MKDVRARLRRLTTLAAETTQFRTVIGLEVHAQLLTKSKMYCGCAAAYADAEPNTHVCMVCLGLPGALPVINRAAIETCILTGIALNCDVPAFCKLDRKNYVYPDLPKGYQISQYDLPLCVDGEIVFETGGGARRAGITRVHIEEDTGRLVHRSIETGQEISLVDLNRSGVPLMEIVGEPDLESPEEARDFLIAMRQLLRYIGASTGNMEEGAFRCDANISTRSLDGSIVGSKVEIKNMNSFRAVERALRYEEERQRTLLANGEAIPQETRGWIEARGITVSQRSKEYAHDYRYFPEPDLPPLNISSAMVAEIQERLPELPAQRKARYVEAFGLSPADAAVVTGERAVADYFESATTLRPAGVAPRTVLNWLVNDLFGLQRERGLAADELPVTVEQLAELMGLQHDGALTLGAAKQVLGEMLTGESARVAAERLNLLALTDDRLLAEAVNTTLAAFPAAVEDYRAGKTAAIGRLIGETIKLTGGRAKPDEVRALLEKALRDPG